MTLSTEAAEADLVAWIDQHVPGWWRDAISAGDSAGIAAAASRPEAGPVLRELAGAGWRNPAWPTELGGRGLDASAATHVACRLRELGLAKRDLDVGRSLVAPTILSWGDEAQQCRHLPAIAQEAVTWCQLFSEPGAGSDLASLATRAVPDGDAWVVKGQKVWSTLAHEADWGILLARTDPDAPKHEGITCFAIDMRQPGVTIRPLRQITGDVEFNEVFFDEATVADADRIGPVNEGWRVSQTTLTAERSMLSALPTVGGGEAERLLLASAPGADQAVLRDHLVRQVIEEQVGQMTRLRIVVAPCRDEAVRRVEATTKLAGSTRARDLANASLGVLGPHAAAWESCDEATAKTVRRFLEAQCQTIVGGTSDIQRNLIGERALGLPKGPMLDKSTPWHDVPRN